MTDQELVAWETTKDNVLRLLGEGYEIWPLETPQPGEDWQIIVFDPSGLQLDTATGPTYERALAEAAALVERDQARRKAA